MSERTHALDVLIPTTIFVPTPACSKLAHATCRSVPTSLDVIILISIFAPPPDHSQTHAVMSEHTHVSRRPHLNINLPACSKVAQAICRSVSTSLDVFVLIPIFAPPPACSQTQAISLSVPTSQDIFVLTQSQKQGLKCSILVGYSEGYSSAGSYLHEQLSAKENKVIQLNGEVAELRRKVFDLEETLAEKEQVRHHKHPDFLYFLKTSQDFL